MNFTVQVQTEGPISPQQVRRSSCGKHDDALLRLRFPTPAHTRIGSITLIVSSREKMFLVIPFFNVLIYRYFVDKVLTHCVTLTLSRNCRIRSIMIDHAYRQMQRTNQRRLDYTCSVQKAVDQSSLDNHKFPPT